VQRIFYDLKLREMEDKLTIIGIGSPHGDDIVAWNIIDALATSEYLCGKITLIKCDRTPFDFWGRIPNDSEVIIIDAILIDHESEAVSPGRVHCFELIEGECRLDIAINQINSSHLIDTLSAIKLAQQIEELPELVEIWAIEIYQPKDFQRLSPEMEKTLERTIFDIRQRISKKYGLFVN